jgi:hypothetical protein
MSRLASAKPATNLQNLTHATRPHGENGLEPWIQTKKLTFTRVEVLDEPNPM